MAVDKLKKAQGNGSSTTLSSSVNNTDTSFPLTSDTAFAGEGMVIVDEGLDTEEFAYATGKVGASLTVPLANRGLDGTSAAAHAAGATVKGILSKTVWDDQSDALENVLLATTGALDTTKALSPTSTNVLTNKTLVQKVTSYTPAGAGTTTIDLTTGNIHLITMPANTQTIAISNEAVGQCFIVEINNVTSQGALTWFTTIRWAGGIAGTLTGTNAKRDVFGFRVTGTDTYDGYIVGKNL